MAPNFGGDSENRLQTCVIYAELKAVIIKLSGATGTCRPGICHYFKVGSLWWALNVTLCVGRIRKIQQRWNGLEEFPACECGIANILKI